MAYNKHQKLSDNIEAITIAFQLERENRRATPAEQEALRKYGGFGGLKFILNRLDSPDSWKVGDRPYYDLTKTLFNVIRENSADDRAYDELVSSVKSSVNTAFYTPDDVITAISRTLSESGVVINRFLDPSSGNGKFLDAFREDQSMMDASAFEKDLLTGKILKGLHPDDKVVVSGFETIPEEVMGTYDVVSSNIPFGDVKVFDPAYFAGTDIVKKSASNTLHNYFFLKGLDAVREGGLVAFITSRGVMDSPSNEPFRTRMMQEARLVSAVRLPDGIFSDVAGTEAGSDLIILQKMHRPENRWTEADGMFRYSTKNSDGINVNQLFDLRSGDNTEDKLSHILADEAIVGTNMYGEKAYEYRFSGATGDLAYRLESILEDDFRDNLDMALYQSHLPLQEQPHVEEKKEKVVQQTVSGPVQLDLFSMWDAIEEEKISMDPRPFNGALRPNWHDGTIVLDGEQLGMLSQLRTSPVFTPMDINDNQKAILKQYIKVRDSYDELYRTEAAEQKERADLREQLNIDYDNFLAKFGRLNDRKNQKVIIFDASGRDALALEYSDGQRFVKADIFDRPVSFNTRELDHVDNATDALSASLNRSGDVDLDYMSGISGISVDDLKEQLRDRIYYNPLEGGYQVADKFLAGNVVDKYDHFYGWKADTKEHMAELQHSLAALEGVLPTPIAFEDLDFNFGERWMPTDYFSEFASRFFDTDIKIEYAPQLDEFIVDPQEATYDKVKINSEYAVVTEAGKTIDGMELLRHALYNTVPNIQHVVGYKPNGDPINGPDHEKIQLAASKIDDIRDHFTQWIDGHDKEWKDGLAEMYNKKYNCFVRANYDGSHQTFPGLDMKSLGEKKNIPSIYASQKDAVWMLLQNGGGICDHEVGTGKTLIMCLAAHEMKRLGMAHKPVIIGMKANVSEIAATYQAAYPNDRILYATPKDFSDRQTFFNRMKNNDYDCIIMSHDQFAMIPQSLETQQHVMMEEIKALEEALEVYGRSHSISSRMLSGLEKRKDNLVASLRELNWTLARRADDVVDFKTMGIDHIFVDESQAFKNLAFTTRDNRVAGLGDPKGSQRARNLQYAIRTIQERTGRDLGATFLSGTTISNSLTELYLLFKYLRPQALSRQDINSFDAWAAVFAKKSRDYEINVAGQVVMKERFRNFIKVPELAAFYNEITDYKTAADVGLERPDMSVQLVNIQPTPDHQDFSKRLLDFANSGDGEHIFRKELSDNEKQAKMLIVTGLGKKASLSPKLVNPDYAEGDDTKIGYAAKNISDYYYKYNEQKGTQFVFCDLSTPKKDEWNAYQELKDRLVNQYGLPEGEIQFMQDASTEKKRKEYIAKMNKGDIRVLFGSTTTLGTGVNAQERCVAIHHMDLPWRPSDMEQRNGRGVRKGNEVARLYADNKVDVFVYAVERSLDSYNFYLLQAKQEFIRQMKTSALGKRSFDQGGEDESNGMPFAEYVAITSGNTDLLERAKLEKRILALESERKAFNSQQKTIAVRLEFAQKDLERDRNILANLHKDLEIFEANAEKNSQGQYVNTLQVGPGLISDEDKGRYLQDNARRLITEEVQVGEIYGFPVVMRPQTADEREHAQKKNINYQGNLFSVKGSIHYRINDGRIHMGSRLGAASFPYEAIMKLPGLVRDYEKSVARLEKEIPDLQRVAGKEWDKTEQLADMKKQLTDLDRKIQQTMDGSILQNNGGKGVEELPFKITQHQYGHEPWELEFLVRDYPYITDSDRDEMERKFHGSMRVHDGTCRGDFRHRFGAESAMMELTKLNKQHMDDVEWQKEAVKNVYDSASLYSYSRLKEMGLDRYGQPIAEKDYHLKVVALGSYADVRALAHGVKDRNDVATEVSAKALARVISQLPESENAVLVPMPGHTHDRDAVERLTKMVAAETGLAFEPRYLVSTEHDSLYEWKKNHPGEALPNLFFIEQRNRVPQGKTPILIDNVLDTGHTAWAALEAMSHEPLLVVLGATGNHKQYGHDVELTVDENSLDYIKNITPVGVGFTGKSQFEIDEMIRRSRSTNWSTSYKAKTELWRIGVDWYTGLPTYETSAAVKKWDDVYGDEEMQKPVENIINAGGYDQLFSEEERQHLTDDDRKRMEGVLFECGGMSAESIVGNIGLAHRLLVNYEYLHGKAQLDMEQAAREAAQHDKEQQPEVETQEQPFASQKEARDFLKSIGSDGQISKMLTSADDRKFIKYYVNGVVTPNIYIGETTPMDVYRQFHLYGNIMDVNIPADIQETLDKERQAYREALDDYWAEERETIKDILKEKDIPFFDVIDCERGCRIVFTDKKNENGNYINWYDVADAEALSDDWTLQSIRQNGETFAAQMSGQFEADTEQEDISKSESDIVSRVLLPVVDIDSLDIRSDSREKLRYIPGEAFGNYAERVRGLSYFKNNKDVFPALLYLQQKFADRLEDVAKVFDGIALANAYERGGQLAAIADNVNMDYMLYSLTRQFAGFEYGDDQQEQKELLVEFDMGFKEAMKGKQKNNSARYEAYLGQYRDLKEKHPDAVLLFRHNDDYATFGVDAETTSRVLGIPLRYRPGRSYLDGSDYAEATFPYYALDTCLPKLIRAGHRVAICDLLEAPKQKVASEVKEVVEPGFGVRMQIVDRSSSLSAEEKHIVSMITGDLQSGNHLLRPRTEEYWNVFNEHGLAIRALRNSEELTSRQRDILLERIDNTYGGIEEVAEELDIDVNRLRNALSAAGIQEQRAIEAYPVVKEGDYYIVDGSKGYGITPDYAKQVAGVYNGEPTEYNGHTAMRFATSTEADAFVRNILLLNREYTNTLRDAIIDKMRNAGISITTDVEEGERVLERANDRKGYLPPEDSENLSWNKILDKWQHGELKRNIEPKIEKFGHLKFLLPEGNFIRVSQHIFTKTRRHEVGLNVLVDLPSKLNRPVLVFNSARLDAAKAKVFIIESQDKLGRPIVVAVNVFADEKGAVINDVTSIYGREHLRDFINWEKKGLLVEGDIKKIQALLNVVPANSMQGVSQEELINFLAKVQQNTETAKEKLEKIREQRVISDNIPIYTGKEARRIYDEILESEHTSRELVFPAHTGALGVFEDGENYVAFDNSSNDCWVEDFRSEAIALSWVRGELTAEQAHKEDDALQNEQQYASFSAKYKVPVADIRRYAEGISEENLSDAQQAYYAIRRAYKEYVKVQLGEDFKLSTFSKMMDEVKQDLYAQFGSVDELRDKWVKQAEEQRDMMDAARQEAEKKVQAEYDRLQPYRDMSDDELDAAYFAALPSNDAVMRDVLNVMAERRGYGDATSEYQGVGAWAALGNPGYETNIDRWNAMDNDESPDVNIYDISQGHSPQPDDYFLNAKGYMYNTPQGLESQKAISDAIYAFRQGQFPGNVMVKVYRAVPKDVEEGMFRNGDWVTPSITYARMHGENRLGIDNYRIIEQEVPSTQLWWDGNDINEWGFDDGQGYRYKNTQNNRKSDDLITRNDAGEIIPPSERFNDRVSDIRFHVVDINSLRNIPYLNSEALGSEVRQMASAGKVVAGYVDPASNEYVFVGDSATVIARYDREHWGVLHTNMQLGGVKIYRLPVEVQNRHGVVFDPIDHISPSLVHDGYRIGAVTKERVQQLITQENLGSFIGGNRPSYMLVLDAQSPIFISNAKLALEKIKQDKATPLQWLKMLEKNGGIKSGEDRWTGLSQWLRDSQENVLTRRQILEYINENSIRVEEVQYMNADNYEDLPRFDEFQEEFDDIKDNLDEMWNEADARYSEFMDAMQEKYGDGWEYEMTNDEILEESRLLSNRDLYNIENSGNNLNEAAFSILANRYSNDFKNAFGHDGGRLYVRDNSYAGEFLSSENPINSIRLEYTTENLNNKREIALTVPTIESWNENDEVHFGDAGNGLAVAWVRFGETTLDNPVLRQRFEDARSRSLDASNAFGSFVSKMEEKYDYLLVGSHTIDEVKKHREQLRSMLSADDAKEWQRLYDIREDADKAVLQTRLEMEEGVSKVLVIDEIQSKRHQEGREKGYGSPALDNATIGEYRPGAAGDEFAFIRSTDGHDIARIYHGEDGYWGESLDGTKATSVRQTEADVLHGLRAFNEFKSIPEAPFEKNWHELTMKRMLRYAAENGYDRVAWLNGLQQAERYSLGGKVESIYINHSRKDKELYSVTVYDRDANIISSASPDHATADDVRELFGKGLGDQLLQGLTDLDRQKALGEVPRSMAYVMEGQELEVGGEGMKAFYDRILPNFMNKYGKQWGVQVEDIDIPRIMRNGTDDGERLHSVRVTGQMKQDVMEGQPMFFRNGEHQAYGFVHNGTIYIDPRIATAETPIHEYTHLWAEVLRQRNPQEWQNIVRMMKDTPEVWNYVRDSYPHLHTDDEIADEALAQFSGKRGYQKLQDFVVGKPDADTIFAKMMKILGDFWKFVGEFFNWHYTSKEEVADRVLYDLLNGVNPLDSKIAALRGLQEQQEDQTQSENFKQWFGDWQHEPGNASKVVDAEGHPLVVEHATNADFTEFDINHLGDNSRDNGLFGAGFYFGTHAPGWMQGAKNVMKVYLDIKHPFEVSDGIGHDIYGEIREKLDTPTMRGLVLTGFNDRQLTVGEYIDHIKEVDNLIATDRAFVDEQIEKDEELQFIHPNERLRVWRRHQIANRTGLGPLGLSWNVVISEHLGSEAFTVAARQDGYDGVIVDRGEGYKEYVAFESNQIKSATDNVGTFLRESNDIRYHFIGERGARNLDVSDGGNRMDMLRHAEELEKAHSSAKDIKVVTGWERGADGMWRFEIPSLRDFNFYGNVEWLARHPEIARYHELLHRETGSVLGIPGVEPLSEAEQSEKDVLRRNPTVRYYDGLATMKNPDKLALQDFVDAPQLYIAYPELRDVPVSFAALSKGEGATYTQEETWEGEIVDRRITVNQETMSLARDLYNEAAKTKIIDTFEHEIQHAIQGAEGFAQGGRPGERITLVGSNLERVRQELQDIEGNADYQAWKETDAIYRTFQQRMTAAMQNERHNLNAILALTEQERELKRNAYMLYSVEVKHMDHRASQLQDYLTNGYPLTFDDYQNLAGEVEARNVASRRHLSPNIRQSMLASATEDVAREQQLVSFTSRAAAYIDIPNYKGIIEHDGRAIGFVVVHEGRDTYLLNIPVHALDRAEDSHVGIGGLDMDSDYEGSIRFSTEDEVKAFYVRYQDDVDYRLGRYRAINDVAVKQGQRAAEDYSRIVPVEYIYKPVPPMREWVDVNNDVYFQSLPAADRQRMAYFKGLTYEQWSAANNISIGNPVAAYYYHQKYADQKDVVNAIFENGVNRDNVRDVARQAAMLSETMGEALSFRSLLNHYDHNTNVEYYNAVMDVFEERQQRLLERYYPEFKAVQGLDDYSIDEIKQTVEAHVVDILAESFFDEDIHIKNITIIGSRSRGEAYEGSDLDVLLEYGGRGVREDTLFDALNEEPLEIEGIRVDINPINEYYSLNTEQWLLRDAEWREQDRQKNDLLNEQKHMATLERLQNLLSEVIPQNGQRLDFPRGFMADDLEHRADKQMLLVDTIKRVDDRFLVGTDREGFLDVSRMSDNEQAFVQKFVREQQLSDLIGEGKSLSYPADSPLVIASADGSQSVSYQDITVKNGELQFRGTLTDADAQPEERVTLFSLSVDSMENLYGHVVKTQQDNKEMITSTADLYGEVFRSSSQLKPRVDTVSPLYDQLDAVSRPVVVDAAEPIGLRQWAADALLSIHGGEQEYVRLNEITEGRYEQLVSLMAEGMDNDQLSMLSSEIIDRRAVYTPAVLDSLYADVVRHYEDAAPSAAVQDDLVEMLGAVDGKSLHSWAVSRSSVPGERIEQLRAALSAVSVYDAVNLMNGINHRNAQPERDYIAQQKYPKNDYEGRYAFIMGYYLDNYASLSKEEKAVFQQLDKVATTADLRQWASSVRVGHALDALANLPASVREEVDELAYGIAELNEQYHEELLTGLKSVGMVDDQRMSALIAYADRLHAQNPDEVVLFKNGAGMTAIGQDAERVLRATGWPANLVYYGEDKYVQLTNISSDGYEVLADKELNLRIVNAPVNMSAFREQPFNATGYALQTIDYSLSQVENPSVLLETDGSLNIGNFKAKTLDFHPTGLDAIADNGEKLVIRDIPANYYHPEGTLVVADYINGHRETIENALDAARPVEEHLNEDGERVSVLDDYTSQKALHPDEILLFRQKGFVEAFGDDAERISEALNVPLYERTIDGQRTNFVMIGMSDYVELSENATMNTHLAIPAVRDPRLDISQSIMRMHEQIDVEPSREGLAAEITQLSEGCYGVRLVDYLTLGHISDVEELSADEAARYAALSGPAAMSQRSDFVLDMANKYFGEQLSVIESHVKCGLEDTPLLLMNSVPYEYTNADNERVNVTLNAYTVNPPYVMLYQSMEDAEQFFDPVMFSALPADLRADVADIIKKDMVKNQRLQGSRLQEVAQENQQPQKEYYHIVIGEDNRPGGVYGEYHVDFADNINAVSYDEMKALAEEYGGETHITEGHEWGDFYRREDAERFAQRVVALEQERMSPAQQAQPTNGRATDEELLSRDETFRYQLLGRLRSDANYFLGNRYEPGLWAGSVEEHLSLMNKLWESLPEKPEWLTREQLDAYAEQMRGSNEEVRSIEENTAEVRQLINEIGLDFSPLTPRMAVVEGSDLREAKGYLMDVLDEARQEIGSVIDVPGSGVVYGEAPVGTEYVEGIEFDGKEYKTDNGLRIADLDSYADVYALTVAVREAQIVNVLGAGGSVTFDGLTVSNDSDSLSAPRKFIDSLSVDDDGKLKVEGHLLDADGHKVPLEDGNFLELAGYDDLYTEVKKLQVSLSITEEETNSEDIALSAADQQLIKTTMVSYLTGIDSDYYNTGLPIESRVNAASLESWSDVKRLATAIGDEILRTADANDPELLGRYGVKNISHEAAEIGTDTLAKAREVVFNRDNQMFQQLDAQVAVVNAMQAEYHMHRRGDDPNYMFKETVDHYYYEHNPRDEQQVALMEVKGGHPSYATSWLSASEVFSKLTEKQSELINEYPQLKEFTTMEEKNQEVAQQPEAQKQQEKKNRFENIDYTKYSMPEGAVVEKANVFKMTTGKDAGKYALSAVINGERKSRILYYNDVTAFFNGKKGQDGAKATLDQLVAKYFGKSTAESMSIGSVGEAEEVRGEQKEAKEQAAAAEEQKQEALAEQQKKKEEEAKKEKKEPTPAAIIQAELLAGALVAASQNDGVWLNKDGKQGPDFTRDNQVVSPFNALMMGLHSDANGYKTNRYMTFGDAKTAGVSVKKGESGLPFNWYNWDKYVSRINSNDVIDKAKYESLPAEEKDLYKVLRTKEERKIFNVDQTTMSAVAKPQYKDLLAAQEKSVLGRGVKDVVEPAEGKTLFEQFKESNPDTLLILRTGEDRFELHDADAEKAAEILHMKLESKEGEAASLVIPEKQLDEMLPKLVRDGQRVSVQNNPDKPEVLRRYGTADQIYGKVSKLVDGLGKVAGEGLVLSSMKNTGYDRAKDVLIINDSRASVAGEEVSTAIARANDTYRAVVAYTGAEDRLNRGAKGKMLPEDAVKYDKLVQEVSAGVLMARQGLPASISKENLDLVPYWERELKEDPKLVERLEGDVNNALQAVSSINKGVAVDYAAMRGERSIEAMKPKYYTIASQIAAIPDMEKRHVVIVRDPANKAAAVILPAGASLEVNNEVPGMNKNRFVIALKKEGIEDVQFYNAGGALGLHQPNEFFVDKTVEVARLKQFEIQTVETLDLKDEIARTSKVEIDQVSMIRDDDNKHVLYVKPANGESFTIYPEADDIRAFFANLKNPDKFDAIRETLGQKYYAFVQNHPEFKANVLMPDVNADLDLSRITKVNIVKDKNKEKSYIMFATIDGESQKPREVSGVQAQRMWLVDDKDMYKVRLAALLFEEKLGITEGQATAQFRDDHEGQGVDNAQEAPEQEEQEEQQQGRRGGFRR